MRTRGPRPDIEHSMTLRPPSISDCLVSTARRHSLPTTIHKSTQYSTCFLSCECKVRSDAILCLVYNIQWILKFMYSYIMHCSYRIRGCRKKCKTWEGTCKPWKRYVALLECYALILFTNNNLTIIIALHVAMLRISKGRKRTEAGAC